MGLTLEIALAMAQATLREGSERGFSSLCVVVLHQGGNALVILRDERASIGRPEIATAKAAGCLGMGFGGRELARRAQAMPQFFTSFAAAFPKGIAPVPGGVLVRDPSGTILGAVGVSADTSDNDEICAVAGIGSAGFQGDTGV